MRFDDEFWVMNFKFLIGDLREHVFGRIKLNIVSHGLMSRYLLLRRLNYYLRKQVI